MKSFFVLLLGLLATGLTAPAASLTVKAGDRLQPALDQAKGGDTITLEAGAVFTGNFHVPVNLSSKAITIQSSQVCSNAWSCLPPAGHRISPTWAPKMAKLVSDNAGPALFFPSQANHYKVIGLEFSTIPGMYTNDLVAAGDTAETDIKKVPQDLLFQQVYVHGLPDQQSKRGLALNSGKAVVVDSYFADFLSDWQDTQAIAGWNGPGPFRIENNFLQSGSEIVAFGGARASIQGLIPSDIIIRRNDFFKPEYWWDGSPQHTGEHIRAKNHLELKNAQRVHIERNTFTNNMVGADQLGCTILLNVRDEYGTMPWNTVSDIVVKNNIFQHVAGGILFMGRDGDGGGTSKRVLVQNNTFLDVGAQGGDGLLFEIINGVEDLTIDHNTALQRGYLVAFAGDLAKSQRVKFTNNIFNNAGSVAGDYGTRGQTALDRFSVDTTFTNNVVLSAYLPYFTGPSFSNNVLDLTSPDQVGFMNLAQGDLRLSSKSPYVKTDSTGKALGSSLKVSQQ